MAGKLSVNVYLQIYIFMVVYVLVTQCDIYLHNPRGSNNRFDENGRERQNPNRLFDSQNNNRGGYNVGNLYYLTGSKLDIEWTNQHSCGQANNHCELILQYMCDDNVRDGTTTKTIPDNQNQCANNDCNTDGEYGMHEDYEYYLYCKTRERNKGLYLVNQKPKGTSARFTRQNPAGTRRGYECSEERDYYPYWHPTSWRDIVVLTNDASRCPFYQEQSHNVKERWACILPRDVLLLNVNKGLRLPITEQECQDFRWPTNDPNGQRAEWKLFPALGGGSPECRENQFSRDNHLGNGVGGYPNTYSWTIPDTPHERCVLRIRYNISTFDYEAWGHVNASHNDGNQKTRLDLSNRFGFNERNVAEGRGYRLTNNPQVQLFPQLGEVKLRLAINTAQYGRTFQDRSHTFAIRWSPAAFSGTTIHNVNVRGKRGNIVQVYPAVEYDFAPNTLKLGLKEHVHFQWTGSNSNPHNNDGQGRAGTDRSNVVLQQFQVYPEGGSPQGTKYGHWGRSYPDLISNSSLLGLPETDRLNLAFLSSLQLGGDMSELDDAGTYFDLGPRKVTMKGVFHYMCTRNNNFSNRSQKGRIICQDSKVAEAYIGWNGGQVTTATGDRTASVNIPRGSLSGLHKVELEQWTEAQAEQLMSEKGNKNPIGGSYSSLILSIKPESKLMEGTNTFEVQMSVDNSGSNIYRTTQDFSTWTKVSPVSIEDGIARFMVQEGGVYVGLVHTNTGIIIGVVVAVLVVLAVLLGGAFLYHRKQPGISNNCMRSFKGKV